MSNTNNLSDFFYADLALHDSGQRIYLTDKGDTHNYIKGYYSNEFSGLREAPVKLLEIGLAYCGSAKLWRDWFINGEINIIEFDSNLIKSIDGVNITLASAYEQETLDMYANNYFDYIIDDGPHTLESQIYAVENWIHKVKDGGKLIIEDIASTYALEELIKRTTHPYKVVDLRETAHRRFDDLILEITKTPTA
jgi:hypothetical protein